MILFLVVEAQVLEPSDPACLADPLDNLAHQFCLGEASGTKLDFMELVTCDPLTKTTEALVTPEGIPDGLELEIMGFDDGAGLDHGIYLQRERLVVVASIGEDLCGSALRSNVTICVGGELVR